MQADRLASLLTGQINNNSWVFVSWSDLPHLDIQVGWSINPFIDKLIGNPRVKPVGYTLILPINGFMDKPTCTPCKLAKLGTLLEGIFLELQPGSSISEHSMPQMFTFYVLQVTRTLCLSINQWNSAPCLSYCRCCCCPMELETFVVRRFLGTARTCSRC